MSIKISKNKRRTRKELKSKLKEKKLLEKQNKKQEKETVKKFKEEDRQVYAETKDKLSILSLAEGGYFITKTGVLDIVKIESVDLNSMSEIETKIAILSFTSLLREYQDDIKLVAMNYPAITTKQQEYISKKIMQCTNKNHLYFLEQRLNQLMSIEKVRSNREYYFIMFGSSEKELKENRRVLFNIDQSILLSDISVEKKIKILRKLNNINSKID